MSKKSNKNIYQTITIEVVSKLEEILDYLYPKGPMSQVVTNVLLVRSEE